MTVIFNSRKSPTTTTLSQSSPSAAERLIDNPQVYSNPAPHTKRFNIVKSSYTATQSLEMQRRMKCF